jgi:hypothetical protein
MTHNRIALLRGLTFVAATSLAAFVMSGEGHANTTKGEKLSGAAIKSLVQGKRIYLAAPFGGELPLFYRADGYVDGSGEAVGLGKYISPSDSGRWWVKNDKLCQKWKEWYKGRTFCFTVDKLPNGKIFWKRDDGRQGIARVGR